MKREQIRDEKVVSYLPSTPEEISAATGAVERHRQRRREREDAVVYAAGVIQRAHIEVTKLAANPDWHFFQQMVQGRIEETRAALQRATDLLTNPDLWKQEDISRMKASVQALKERIRTYEEILVMPDLLRETAAAAQDTSRDITDGRGE